MLINVRQGIRSTRARETLRYGVQSYNFSYEIIGNASISQALNYEISHFIELTLITVTAMVSFLCTPLFC